MNLGSGITSTAVKHYKWVTAVMVAAAVVVVLAAALPSIWPGWFRFLHPARVDTDPENMLGEEEPVRIFHRRMKRELSLHDMVVVGVVNDRHPEGVFNAATLRKIHALTEFAKTLTGDQIGAASGQGVIEADIIAPSTVDFIEPSSAGVLQDYLMKAPPGDDAQALQIRNRAMRVPFLKGTLVSEDGKALCLYLPLTAKDLSYAVYSRLRRRIAEFGGPEKFHITGLPVAEDTFGVEMFIQMAISAPAAMGVIFILMLLFFRKIVIVLAPMIVALVSVIFTMGALIIAGFPIHIMSSMIPIFIMPIAVLDSIHIISEFFERYQATRDRRKTIVKVMDELFAPMLYTSLTSAAGFASLALTPIPPVQVFGVFVAAGIMVAWLLTVTFIPAYVMFIPPRILQNFGARHDSDSGQAAETRMSRFLRWVGGATYRRARTIIVLTAVVLIAAGVGIYLININDNPVKWFSTSHPIRRADAVLNRHFGGTYMAYLAISAEQRKIDDAFVDRFMAAAKSRGEALRNDLPAGPRVFDKLAALAAAQATQDKSRQAFFESLAKSAREARAAVSQPGKPEAERVESGEPGLLEGLEDEGKPTTASAPAEPAAADSAAWDIAALFISQQRQREEIFKKPEVLRYLARLQDATNESEVVGKSNSLADIVRTVYRDLRLTPRDKDEAGKMAAYYRIPDTREGVADCLLTYQGGHRANDLWHFATTDYRKTSMWVQLTSGDNRDMRRVVDLVDGFVRDNPLPEGLKHRWFGLTYINVEWQEKMVSGMVQAFAGSFLVVFLLMTILFRSALWGMLSMVPLVVTIAAVYGVVGFVGKDYDMPVAVLSSLALGLAVDFAIHFLARSRTMYAPAGSWQAAAPRVFGEPARAIMRNIIVIAVGFLPLLLAPLVPYKTVGILMAAILLVSGVATLLILPALIRVLEKLLFPQKRVMVLACNCGTCAASGVALAAIVVMSIYRYLDVGWNLLVVVSIVVVLVTMVLCRLLARREKCKMPITKENEND